MNMEERSQILDAIFRAAREAAEVPLTAEEDGEVFISFVVQEALRLLAEEGAFVAPVEVRAVLRALTGYGKAG
jgi:hypothetical protein